VKTTLRARKHNVKGTSAIRNQGIIDAIIPIANKISNEFCRNISLVPGRRTSTVAIENDFFLIFVNLW
jgi:hypothetical protein